MAIKIKVEEKHIQDGKRGSPGYCPIALAIEDAGYWYPVVDKNIAEFIDNEKGWAWEIDLPNEARSFIMKYDAGIEVHPFEFEVAPFPQNGENDDQLF